MGMTNTQRLIEATTNRDNARTQFNSLKPGTKAWRLAEEDLNFWQGKVAAAQITAR